MSSSLNKDRFTSFPICLLFIPFSCQLPWRNIQSFTIKKDGIVMGILQMSFISWGRSLLFLVCWVFSSWKCVGFCQVIFYIYRDDHVSFVLLICLYYTNWFSYYIGLHSWSSSHLIMLYNLFIARFDIGYLSLHSGFLFLRALVVRVFVVICPFHLGHLICYVIVHSIP